MKGKIMLKKSEELAEKGEYEKSMKMNARAPGPGEKRRK